MNHCLIQAVINSAPQMRYTKENQTPIAEMIVNFKGLRSEDPTRDLKIIGWGNIAQEMVDELKEGQNIVIEGRLKMNSVTRKDGTKEKQAELTASKIHQISPVEVINSDQKENNESFEKIEKDCSYYLKKTWMNFDTYLERCILISKQSLHVMTLHLTLSMQIISIYAIFVFLLRMKKTEKIEISKGHKRWIFGG